MRFKSRLCLLTLCAFALLLGLVTAGCSSQGREGSKQAITTKTITYSYAKSDAPSVIKGVPSTAEYIYVTAYDANNNELYSALQNNDEHDAWAGYDASSSTYNAVTVVDTKTDHMLYTFTYTDEESGSEVEIYTDMVSDVTDIEDGGIVKESDPEPTVVKYSCKFYGSDGEELPADKVTVDDQFSVRVFATDGTTEQDISDKVDSLTFAPAELLEEGTAWTYTAKAEGTVKFSAEIEEVEYRDIGSITIVQKEIPGEPAYYLCPPSYSVSEGRLYDNASAQVNDPESIPEEISGVYYKDCFGDTPYTFVVVLRQKDGSYIDQSNVSTLSVSPSDGISFEGCKMSLGDAYEVSQEQYTVSAQVGDVTAANTLAFTPIYYNYNCYICPNGYSVANGVLKDPEGNDVALEDIPGDLELTNGDEYTFTFAVVNREGTLVKGRDGYVVSSNENVVSPVDFKLEVEAISEGQANVSVEEYAMSMQLTCLNSIAVTVVATPVLEIYICPEGYSVSDDGQLLDPFGYTVDNPDDISSEIDVESNEEYNFVLVTYSGKSWSYYNITGSGYKVVIEDFSEVVASNDTSGTLTIPEEITMECYAEVATTDFDKEMEVTVVKDLISKNQILLNKGEEPEV